MEMALLSQFCVLYVECVMTGPSQISDTLTSLVEVFQIYNSMGPMAQENKKLYRVTICWGIENYQICNITFYYLAWYMARATSVCRRASWVQGSGCPSGNKLFVGAVKSSPPGQNVRLFTDNIFICISVNKKFYIFIKISLKFVPKGPIDNNPPHVILWNMCWQASANLRDQNLLL